MEIKLVDPNKKEDKTFIIKSYKKIAENNHTLIALHGEISDTDRNKKLNSYEIFKVQFIAACTIDEVGEILVAFYFGVEGNVLCAQPLDYDLKKYNIWPNYTLIDYKSYLEICELTGEDKMPFKEYFKTIVEGEKVINYLVEDDRKFMHLDELQN